MNDHKKETRTISQIRNGTVIDHLKPDVVFQVIRILDIDDTTEETVTVGTNLKSKALGKKGIIKISDRVLTPEEVNRLSVISPNATVSIIEDYEVKKKFKVLFPREVRAILGCPNPNCITNVEGVETRFRLTQESPIILFCTYCERYFRDSELEIL
jgi:aspartate carbamoyltransferase regulatory subunit